MLEAREDMLAFRHFPHQHWRKVWSINLLERVNEEIKLITTPGSQGWWTRCFWRRTRTFN